jgi:hypothetical protein
VVIESKLIVNKSLEFAPTWKSREVDVPADTLNCTPRASAKPSEPASAAAARAFAAVASTVSSMPFPNFSVLVVPAANTLFAVPVFSSVSIAE